MFPAKTNHRAEWPHVENMPWIWGSNGRVGEGVWGGDQTGSHRDENTTRAHRHDGGRGREPIRPKYTSANRWAYGFCRGVVCHPARPHFPAKSTLINISALPTRLKALPRKTVICPVWTGRAKSRHDKASLSKKTPPVIQLYLLTRCTAESAHVTVPLALTPSPSRKCLVSSDPSVLIRSGMWPYLMGFSPRVFFFFCPSLTMRLNVRPFQNSLTLSYSPRLHLRSLYPRP